MLQSDIRIIIKCEVEKVKRLFGTNKPEMRKKDTKIKKNGKPVRQNGAKKNQMVTEFPCPYCFNTIRSDEVAFRAMTVYTQQDLDTFSLEEKEKKTPYLMSTDELYEAFWNRYPGSKPEDEYEKYPVISPSDPRYLTNAKVPAGLELVFQTDIEGFVNEVIDTEGCSSTVRICPYCHNRLPFEFGKYPVKFIAVVGITSSGKTIYLSQMLKKIREFLFQADMTVAGMCPEVDEFVREHSIQKGKELPVGNAADALTKPIPIHVKNNQTGERATLVFYDIAGENCVNPDQMNKYGPFIKNADAMIMVIDPKQFSDLLFLEEEKETEEAYHPDQVAQAMYQAFAAADYYGGECKVPLAIAISKSDLLRSCKYVDENSNIFQDIDYSSYNGRGFPYDDWINIDAEVRTLLKQRTEKGRLLDQFLSNFFPEHAYFAFSALNAAPTIVDKAEDITRYQMDMLPKTVRIEEALYWLLFKMDMIQEVRKSETDSHSLQPRWWR